MEVAGIGAADYITGSNLSDYSSVIQRIHKYSSDKCSRCRYYGGFSFYKEETVADEWEPFGAYNFVLPQFEMIRDAEEDLFICNLIHPDDNTLIQLARAIENISFGEAELKSNLPGIAEVTYWPGNDRWQDIINSARRRR